MVISMDNYSDSGSDRFAPCTPASNQSVGWFEHLGSAPVAGERQPISACVDAVPCVQGLSKNALNRVQIFLQLHIGEALELEDLAQVACMSRFHFARMFRRSLKQSPMRYVLKLRVDLGKEKLLSEKGKTVAAIASELGFCDQSHFTRSFRRLTGITPARFARGGAAAAHQVHINGGIV